MESIKYVYQTLKIFIKNLFFYKYDFKLAIFKNNNINSPIIIKSKKRKFLADPFLVKHNNKTYCFAEEYDHVKKKGHIVCFNLDKKELNKKIVLNENFHLSFPFVFKFKNNFFMCPETSKVSEIRLYKKTKFPLKWYF